MSRADREPPDPRVEIADRISEMASAFYFDPAKATRKKPKKSARCSAMLERMLERLNLDPASFQGAWETVRDDLEKHAQRVCTTTPKCAQCPFVSFCTTGQRIVALEKKPVVVDLFGGAGGLGKGFLDAGFRVGLAIELDRDAAQTYRFNNPGTPVLEADVAMISTRTIRTLIRTKPHVVCAGPPCQSFSAAGLREKNDARHGLFEYVLDIAHHLNPEVVLIENVPGIARTLRNRQNYKDIIAEDLGRRFEVEVHLLNAVDYGVPQLRRRYVFLGRRRDSKEIGAPPKTHAIEVSAALPLTPTVIEMLRAIPCHPQGWKRDWHRYEDGTFVRNLTTMTHSKHVVRKIRRVRGGEGPLSYRRVPKTYARTLISGHRALPVHPYLHRTISSREAACIQGFPLSYVFFGRPSNQPLQVANAVPPALAAAIAKRILAHLALRSREDR